MTLSAFNWSSLDDLAGSIRKKAVKAARDVESRRESLSVDSLLQTNNSLTSARTSELLAVTLDSDCLESSFLGAIECLFCFFGDEQKLIEASPMIVKAELTKLIMASTHSSR